MKTKSKNGQKNSNNMTAFSLFILSALMSGCTDFLRENCYFEKMNTMLVGASIGLSDGRPRPYFVIDKTGYRTTNTVIAPYGMLDFGSAEILLNKNGVPQNISADFISSNLVSFLILWTTPPETMAPFMIAPLLLGGETGLKYKNASMGILTKVNPYFERGISYKIGPTSSLTIGHTRVAVDLGFEFNNFNREAIKYSQNRIGLSLGLM